MHMDSDYWNALDQGKKMRVDPSQIGISHGVGDVSEGLKANVFRGAKIVELGFMGGGKGSRSQPGGHTPESYGIRERQEMRELAKINEVEVSTHASPNVGFAAGWQEGEFRPETREFVLHEVERAIDFAADVGQGGPVVMHLGEFPRPMWDLEKKKGGEDPLFKAYPEEKEKSPIIVVDKRTGRTQTIPRNMEVAIPVAQKGHENDPWKYPEIDPETGHMKMMSKKISDFEKEALDKGKEPGAYIFDNFISRQKESIEGQQGRIESRAKEIEQQYKDIEERKNRLEEFKKINPAKAEYDARELAKKMGLAPSEETTRYKDFIENPFGYIDKTIQDLKTAAESHHLEARSLQAQKYELEQEIKNKEPIVKYGLRQTAETISRAAMSAYEMEKERHLKKPLWIAPENWTPEQYGSHPKEYRDIIKASRDKMAEELVKHGTDKQEAEEIAKSHIKGTFDIGHANFWYKYYEGPKKDFDQWLTKEVEKLTKDGIIGHVHLSDNFGYHDEHLAPGEGSAPIQRFVEKIKEAGYTGQFISEPGGQKEGRYHQALTESWKLFGSPMYKIDATSQSWTDIESSYFGRSQSPNFIVGDYAPSKDWTLWSETPLE